VYLLPLNNGFRLSISSILNIKSLWTILINVDFSHLLITIDFVIWFECVAVVGGGGEDGSVKIGMWQ
jgi:hypothetical protein